MKKGVMIYEGKAKKLFQVLQNAGAIDEGKVWVEYKNSLTAFNALKKGEFEGKGKVNLQITSLLFKKIQESGIKTHWIETVSDTEMVAEKVTIIPLEVVVRNTLAGSTAKKMGRAEGEVLKKPLVEFYYKNDDLADPFVSDDQIEIFEIATAQEIAQLKQLALMINQVLKENFLKAKIQLVDFKIEFGKNKNGEMLLADEISPDCMRLWDAQSGEKLDKDRFRRDLGQVKESYEEVLQRLQRI